MRWCHAHPTWTFWSLPFLADLLLERLVAAHNMQPQEISVWKLAEAQTRGVMAVLADSSKEQRVAKFRSWMREDEDMLNVAFWRAGVNKSWCKFDNYPQIFMMGYNVDQSIYADSKWFPDGIPLVFYS